MSIPQLCFGTREDPVARVEYLQDCYTVSHLGDAIGPGGLMFDYHLVPGPATSRNAIALLELGGAPEFIVTAARRAWIANAPTRRSLPRRTACRRSLTFEGESKYRDYRWLDGGTKPFARRYVTILP